MKIQDIVAGVNAKLAGETLTYTQMRILLDEVVDDINTELAAKYPSFDEIPSNGVYDAFPDKYIRSVIIVGAAFKFYVTDEEGISTATQYSYDYKDRLFYMKRDYTGQVPELYQDRDQGYVTGTQLEIDNLGYTFGGW